MIRRIALLRRRPGMTPDEFWAHYSGPHVAIVERMPGLRRLTLSRPAGAQRGVAGEEWDAVGEVWFDTMEALERAFGDPEIAAQLQADRPLFIGAAQVLVVEEVLHRPAEP